MKGVASDGGGWGGVVGHLALKASPQMMWRLVSSQRGGFPSCCVSRSLLHLLFVVFQTISSCRPAPFHPHPPASRVCTWYAMQCWQFVRVWIPIMELLKPPHSSLPCPPPHTTHPVCGLQILIKPYIKEHRITFKWSSCFSFVCRRHGCY